MAGNVFNLSNLLAVVTCIVGVAAGWGISHCYYEKAKSDAVREAIEQGRKLGRDQGHAEGVKEGIAATEANLPNEIERRFPGVKQQAIDLGFAKGLAEGRVAGVEEGRKQGFTEGEAAGNSKGRDVGYKDGLKDGRDVAAKDYSLQSYAEKNWLAYANKVNVVAGVSDDLEREPGNRFYQSQLISEARALVDSAESLRAAYLEKAEAFNSTMKNLKAALESRNFPQMRDYSRAIRASLEIKQNLFLQANIKIVSIFETIHEGPRLR